MFKIFKKKKVKTIAPEKVDPILLEFAKKGQETAQKYHKLIEESASIKEFQVAFSSGNISVSGFAETEEEKQKVTNIK